MKAIILAAGYGTRLAKDLGACQDDRLKRLRHVAKALLPVAGQPLLTHWIRALCSEPTIEEIVVITNSFFWAQFEDWRRALLLLDDGAVRISLINDGSTCNADRCGAVADIHLAAASMTAQPSDGLLVIAGDTLFPTDFSLSAFISQYLQLRRKFREEEVCLIVDCPCPEDQIHLHGIVQLDEASADRRVTSFLEKPLASSTQSRLQSPCFYLLDTACLDLLSRFLLQSSHLPLEKRDACGLFLAQLVQQAKVFSFHVSQRFDIGNLQSYLHCCRHFRPE